MLQMLSSFHKSRPSSLCAHRREMATPCLSALTRERITSIFRDTFSNTTGVLLLLEHYHRVSGSIFKILQGVTTSSVQAMLQTCSPVQNLPLHFEDVYFSCSFSACQSFPCVACIERCNCSGYIQARSSCDQQQEHCPLFMADEIKQK